MPTVDGHYAMNPHVAKRRAAEAKGKSHGGKLRRMVVEPADSGGHVIDNEYADEDQSDGIGSMHEKHVFGSAEEAGAHVTKHLKKHEGKSQDEESYEYE